jgi:tetratricopeptide (TPR) repeat protein
VWQALRTELHPKGLEIVTVALDIDPEAAKAWIQQTNPDHPSLIDSSHLVDELFGVINVPNSIWIDEEGNIVRPVEVAYPERPNPPDWQTMADSPDIPPQLRETLQLAKRIQVQPKEYTEALRDWVANGKKSRYALAPEDVVARSTPRGKAEAEAAAQFELGHYLWDQGKRDLAPKHWREAHRLQPDNWTYKRQAWSLADPFQGKSDLYDSCWVEDVKKIGPENYYPKLNLEPSSAK